MRGKEDRELERSLGLKDALAIGIGTMVGAGIFIFPGMAGARAGAGASISFAIGTAIALMVALPLSELSSAMPETGGGFYFVNRLLGSLAGNVIGVSLWTGLIFASAFYLVGFGSYANELLAQWGYSGIDPVYISAGLGTLLIILGITGTRNSGRLQVIIVAILLLILVSFLFYAGGATLGINSTSKVPSSLFPKGLLPVLSTSALIFTSFLGFAQIPNVAGEIKDPRKNLPRAILISIVVAGVLYIGFVLVTVGILGTENLEASSQTAVIDLGRELLGFPGAIVIILGGLLATLSSANASIIGSSRVLFSLGKQRLLPRVTSRINRKFSTPHVALVMAGVPIVMISFMGKIETLAESASMLHLVMYAAISLSLFPARNGKIPGYDPAFKAPGYPVLPVMGALLCVGVIAFMDLLSIIIGISILAASVLWYFIYQVKRRGDDG